MEFRFTDQQLDIQKRIKDYCQKELAPRAAELDAAPADRTPVMIRERIQGLAREGLLGVGYPEEAGGSGGDMLGAVLLFQEIGGACPSTGLAVLSSVGLCARALYEFGPQAARDKYLADLLKGETIGSYGSQEAGASLDDWDFKTTASSAGDGATLKGEKSMVLNAPTADLMVFTAIANGSPALFLVDHGTAGLEIPPPQEKLGCRGVPTADVKLIDCPATGISPENGAEAVAGMRSYEHLLLAALSSGILNTAMITSGVYARDHLAGDKPLGRHQETSFKMADTLLFREVSQMLIYRCVWMMEENNTEARVLASSAKLFASESTVQAANWGMQIAGQDGYQKGSFAEKLYRDAKLVEILGDSTERHRMFIADQVLDQY